ncbi:uncharacterized protein LOC133512571 isoform X2 [Syngnathoides biaculeatus]|uniref:uncharacterized protein LOC133512571 isoform X2 n=1 Tax=Syngnathoides biaculeatus TaxID=300417 RepID=UPI002ADD9437|nr:uncharacterized protein LOC133512571 isoform X2 [Syngnathoides biaculeatus]
MAYQNTTSALDRLLCRLVIEMRELFQKKNDLDREVEVCKADIAEKRTCIETTRAHIKALEEDADVKRNNLKHNQAVAKSMKVTQGLLQQYNHTLKGELESVKASYISDKEVFEEKIASYKKLFQEHQKPLAHKLQALNDDTESPIVAVEAKRGGGAYVTESGAPCSSLEKGPESDLHRQSTTTAAMEMETSRVTESTSHVSAVNVTETNRCLSGPQTSGDGNPEGMDAQSEAQESFFFSADERRSNEQHVRAEVHRRPDEMSSEDEGDKEIGPLSQGKQSAASEEEESARGQMEEGAPAEEEEEPAPHEHVAQPQSSAVPRTPTFQLSFSPAESPLQGLSDTKSPAFRFSLNSNPSTPGFSSFLFDAVSSNDEPLSFPFSSSFFTDKKNEESKSGDLDFLFNQLESDDFQFPFTAENPADNMDNTADLPFSFNF